MREPEVGVYCPRCSRYAVYPAPLMDGVKACCGCGQEQTLRASPALLAGAAVDRCPSCDNQQFYRRKDLPQQVGCAAVAATIALSTGAYAIGGFLASGAVLLAASFLDLLLYYRLAEVTVCYRCHSELRGFPANPSHGPFDLNRAEEYEQGR